MGKYYDKACQWVTTAYVTAIILPIALRVSISIFWGRVCGNQKDRKILKAPKKAVEVDKYV